jgi:hypothetical protein
MSRELFIVSAGDHPVDHADDVLLERLRALLAAAGEGLASQDPARADTSVAVAVREPGRDPVPFAVLHLAEPAVTVTPGGGAAEVDLELTRQDLEALIEGRLHLPMAIARGDVAFRGPVRRLLRITPVLRGVAAAMAEADAGPPADTTDEEQH